MIKARRKKREKQKRTKQNYDNVSLAAGALVLSEIEGILALKGEQRIASKFWGVFFALLLGGLVSEAWLMSPVALLGSFASSLPG